jgi:protein-tyrosine phosphatase
MTVTRVSFVCSGNICRSPLAEGIFKHQVQQAGLSEQLHIESFGIGPWHVGESPDRRAQLTAQRHGLRLTSRAQQWQPRDFARFDHVLALDADVADYLRRLAPTEPDRRKVRLLREHDPALDHSRVREQPAADDLDVPDPYYGGPEGFEDAYQMIERSGARLLESLREQGGRG